MSNNRDFVDLAHEYLKEQSMKQEKSSGPYCFHNGDPITFSLPFILAGFAEYVRDAERVLCGNCGSVYPRREQESHGIGKCGERVTGEGKP